jgi:hypothetical protein
MFFIHIYIEFSNFKINQNPSPSILWDVGSNIAHIYLCIHLCIDMFIVLGEQCARTRVAFRNQPHPLIDVLCNSRSLCLGSCIGSHTVHDVCAYYVQQLCPCWFPTLVCVVWSVDFGIKAVLVRIRCFAQHFRSAFHHSVLHQWSQTGLRFVNTVSVVLFF